MENLQNTKEQYNAEPVTFCKHCLSLKIRVAGEVVYCDECGNTELGETDIHHWEELYEQKYGIKFLNKKKNGRERQYLTYAPEQSTGNTKKETNV